MGYEWPENCRNFNDLWPKFLELNMDRMKMNLWKAGQKQQELDDKKAHYTCDAHYPIDWRWAEHEILDTTKEDWLNDIPKDYFDPDIYFGGNRPSGEITPVLEK